MRKLMLIFVMCILTTAVYSEEASVLSEGNLRLGESCSYAVAENDEVGWGFGAEYAMSDWLNLQVIWKEGFIPSPKIGSSTLYLGLKTYILGDGALVPVADQWLRLSAAIGFLLPPNNTGPNLLDQDQKMWGSSLRLYSDFIINRFFYVNLYFEGAFYPPQRSNSGIFYGELVSHYLDLTGELELRFEVPVKDGIVLIFGAPVRFFYAPWMNAADEHAVSQYLLTTGGYFGVTKPEGNPPVEIYFRYNANILGQYAGQAHHVSLFFKVTFDIGTMKSRAEKSANVESENE